MPQPWDTLSNAASIVGIADSTISRGSQLVTFLEKAKDSEQTLERVKRETSPLREVTARLKDKLQSPSGSKLPFQDQIMLACINAQTILVDFQGNLESWVGEEENHSVLSSLGIAFRHEQVEATMAELRNWRSTIELSMTASILVQGERQAVETVHLSKRVAEILQSLEKQKQTVKDAISTVLEDHLNTSNNLKKALERQEKSAEALAQLCNKVNSEVATLEANFGKVNVTERAVLYTGIMETPTGPDTKGTPMGPIVHKYDGISGGGDTFSAHSIVNSSIDLARLAKLYYRNRSQRDNREEKENTESDLPPSQIDITSTSTADTRHGTSVPPSSMNFGLRNQDTQKDPSYQRFADAAEPVQTDHPDIQLPYSRFKQYSSELAGCLLKDLKQILQTRENIRDISKSLPVIFKAFALRLAQQSQSPSSQRQFEVVYFVYRFREAISKMVEEHWYKQWSSEGLPEAITANHEILSSEKCETWLEQAGLSKDSEPLNEPDSAGVWVSDDEDNDMSVEDLAEYHKLVCSSPAYSWLLECIRRNASLNLQGAATVSSLADQIINALPTPSRISLTRPIFPLSMKFTAPWNPSEFLRQQGHEGETSHIISKIITLTGQVVDAQATTTEQYLHQTWPATGGHFLGAIETGLRAQKNPDGSAGAKVITYVYPDQTRIKPLFSDQGLELDVTGSAYSIAEVGEQLGWLMSALQSSSSTTSMSSSRPILRSLVQTPMTDLESSVIAGRYICLLDCIVEPLQPTVQQQNGQCWHKLFNNPVIVADYPVLPRSCLKPSMGLEVPFDILIALAETPVLTSFGQSTLMKGYSTMLVPVLEICNMIVWHFLFNHKGDRLSFLDSRLSDLDSVDPAEVDSHQTRHIIGWCSEARSMTGSTGANYNIAPSGLRPPRNHHTWKNLSMTASRVPLGAGLNFEISKKDKLVSRGFPKPYGELIRFLKNQHVVLYDVATRCAWLVDGPSAVLHLVLASLEKDLKESGEDSNDCLFRRDMLQNAPDHLDGMEAACNVLRNKENYLLELSVDISYHDEWSEDLERSTPASPPKIKRKFKKTPTCFKDRVMEICTSLEKIVDHMNNRNKEDGINFVLRAPRGNLLGGFDFMDIANNDESFSVREMPLHRFGVEQGWTTLTSSLRAITLFGSNFGDLIKPVMLKGMRACDACGFGAAVPRGKDHLMARSSLVKSVLEKKGDSTAHPWQIVDGLYWQAPHATFQPCGCVRTADDQRHILKLKDRIQVLHRSRMPAFLNRASCLNSVPTNGALIFELSLLPAISTGRGDEGSPLEICETENPEETARDTVSSSSMVTSSSGSGGHTQRTSGTSVATPNVPKGDGVILTSDSDEVHCEGKGKGLQQRTANALAIPDRSSRKRPWEATSSDDSTAATGSGKKKRLMERLHLS